MVAFRFLAWLVLALAIALLGADAVSSLEAGAPVIRTTAEVLSLVGLDVGGPSDGAGGASAALSTVLSLPLWSVFGLLGFILILIFRPID